MGSCCVSGFEANGEVGHPRCAAGQQRRTHLRGNHARWKSVEIRRQGAYRCIALCRNHPCEYGDRSVLALENRLVPAHRPRHTRQSRLQSRCQLPRFVPFGRGTQGGTTCRTANFGSVENHLRRTLAVARAGAEELVRVRSFLQRRIVLYGFGYRFRPRAPSTDGCWRQHR